MASREPMLTVHAAFTKGDIERHVANEVSFYESLPGLWTVALNGLAITSEKSKEDAEHTASMLSVALHNSIVKLLEP